MTRTFTVSSDTNVTTAGHWVRSFNIFVSTTESVLERGISSSRQIPGWNLDVTSGGEILTWVDGSAPDGTPRRFLGYQWTVNPAYEVVLAGTVAISERIDDFELVDDATPASVETAEESLRWIKKITGLSDGDIGGILGVSRPTLDAWRRGENISLSNLRRLCAVRDVLRRASERVPSVDLLRAWLVTPRLSDGRTPEDLLRANETDRVRLLAMSVPPIRVARPPTWVRQSIPDQWANGAERRQEPELPEDEQDLPIIPRRNGTTRITVNRRGK